MDSTEIESPTGELSKSRTGGIEINTTSVNQILDVLPIDLISVNNGMLQFPDRVTLDLTLQQLNLAKKEWTSKLNTAFENFEGDPDEVDVDELYPLSKFNTFFNYNSLKEQIDEQTTIWLQNEELDFDLSPEKHPCRDRVLKTVYNEYAEVIVGNSILGNRSICSRFSAVLPSTKMAIVTISAKTGRRTLKFARLMAGRCLPQV